MQRNDQLDQYDASQRNALNFQFSPDELRVLRECNRESFFQRSLPLGTLMGFGAWYAMHTNYLKASARFGPAPKVLVGVTLGYFIGKISYQPKCAEKILQLPNSRLADLMRQRRQGASVVSETFLPDQRFGASSMLTPFASPPGLDQQSNEEPVNQGSLNMDFDIPHFSGLDDSGRPTIDSMESFEEDLSLPLASKTSKSYEELRRQNREEYLKRQQQPHLPRSMPDDNPPIRRDPIERKGSFKAEDEPVVSAPSTKNKYGDAWSQ